MADAKANPTRVLIGSPEFPARFSFLHAFVPQPKKDDNGNVVMDDDGNKVLMYSAQIIVSKKDKAGVAAINAAVEAAIAEEFGAKKPANLKMPLRDGDAEADEKGEHLVGCWFFNCSAKSKPNVVGTAKNELTGKLEPLAPDEIKSGDYGRVTINFYGYNVKNKGIAAGLGNIQKLKDGEPLGSQRSADDDFGDIEDGFVD